MVFRAIYNLDALKVTGPDRIPAIALKMCSRELSPFLLSYIINSWLSIIVGSGEKWLVTYNATETKQLSFNCN